MNNLDKARQRLNIIIEELQKEGYTYPTQYAYMQEAFDQIIIPPGMKNSGKIKSLTDANKYIERKFGKNFTLSKSEYYEQLRDLLSEIKDINTKQKFLKEKREQYKVEIDQYLNGIDISNYSTSELRDILNQAWRQTKEDPDGSPTFSDHLYDILMGE